MQRSALTPSLYVPDVAKAVSFYETVLGFRQTGEWAEDGVLVWAEVTRDGPKGPARLWFFGDPIKGRPGPALSGVLYIFVASADSEAERLQGKATVLWGPEDQDYGLREVGIEDLNGYMLCFAQDI